MIVLGLEEFASKRRRRQEEIEAALRPAVARAIDGKVNTGGYDELLGIVADQWSTVFFETGGEHDSIPATFRDQLHRTLRHTDRGKVTEATVDRITVWLATAVLSHATMTAAEKDPADLLVEWVSMNDDHVRESHREAAGQVRPMGERFRVGSVEMWGPGDPSVPIEFWINCRCTLRPVLAEEALVASTDQIKTTVIVALPAADHPINGIGPEQKHATLLFFGEVADDEVRAAIHEATAGLAKDMQPFTQSVGDVHPLGEDDPQAQVLAIQGSEGDAEMTLETLRNYLLDNETVAQAWNSIEQYPSFTPHVTLGYGDEVTDEDREAAAAVGEVLFDRLAVWDADQQTEYALGGTAMDPDENIETEKPTDEDIPEVEDDGGTPPLEDIAVPWYGVLAPEGKKSGDGRGFRQMSLSNRPLPLPLTWQKSSSDGHSQAIVVSKIERIVRVGDEARATGHYLMTPEADEAVGLVAEFGRFGVSVDADDAQFELDEDEETVWFSAARIAGAAMVAIPAFHEAFIALGEPPEGFMDGEPLVPVDPETEEAPEDDALVAADVAPGRTEDGPGWLTHPVDTDRLRDYWVSGPGAAKIGWGTGGDFNRCRVNVAEYVKPQHINGYCANRHYDALGYWPGSHHAAKDALTDTPAADSVTLTASAYGSKAPHEWFSMEEPDEPTPLTITEDGQVYGHIAAWNTCHSSFEDTCVVAPKSMTGYAHFLLGEVLTDKGPVATGPLTIGGGHAGQRLRMRAAIEHYDNSCAAWADVTVKDGKHGIWACGWVRPGTPEEMVHAARASKPSGDWRRDPRTGNLEMIAALSVNTPGFRVPRIAAGVEGGVQMSLVAAGVLASDTPPVSTEFDMEKFAVAVAAVIERREAMRSIQRQVAESLRQASEERRKEMAALAARFNTTT